ncbi:MAG: tetratricopeptide repeat protein [Bacillota bacterium]
MAKYIFVVFLLITARLTAQNEVPGLIYRGLDYSYNFQTSEAENCFQQIINKYPDDPRGYHYKSSIYLWTYLSNKDKSDYDRFIKLSDIAIDKAEKALDRNSNDENALYVLGSNYGFRAMAFTKENSSLNAVWAARNSNKYLNKTLEKFPYNNDAYLGKGLFSFAFSFVPGVFKWALNLAGLSGSQEEGIRYLLKAFKYGKYTKTEAAYYLSQIYSDIRVDYPAAADYLRPIIKKYPQNSLFQYSYAVVMVKDRKPQEAEKSLQSVIRINNPRFQQVSAYSNFLLGDIYYHKNDFRNAITYYQKFLVTAKDIDYTGIAYLRTAISFEILKNRPEAQRNYILARNGNLDIADDAYAKRKGEIYYDHPLTENEIDIIKASNNIESGRYSEAYNALIQLLPKASSDKQKGEILQYLSDVTFELEKINDSIEYANRALKTNIKDEKWIKPFSFYYGARAFLKAGNKAMASRYLEQAEGISDYDYKSKLSGFINALKLKI